jgi:hypothetical protein
VSIDPDVLGELEDARGDLEDILVEILGTVFAEEAFPVEPQDVADQAGDPAAVSRLEIHDPGDDTYTVVEVRLGLEAARALAFRMLQLVDPGQDDLLDAVGELGNIAAGNVKSLLRHASRLSLPSAALTVPGERDLMLHDMVRVAAAVQGHVVQLGVIPADTSDGALWPGSRSHA